MFSLVNFTFQSHKIVITKEQSPCPGVLTLVWDFYSLDNNNKNKSSWSDDLDIYVPYDTSRIAGPNPAVGISQPSFRIHVWLFLEAAYQLGRQKAPFDRTKFSRTNCFRFDNNPFYNKKKNPFTQRAAIYDKDDLFWNLTSYSTKYPERRSNVSGVLNLENGSDSG